MSYIEWITIEQMKELDLFDDVPYKVMKKILKLDEETEFEVDIKNIPHKTNCVSFEFKLETNLSQGILPIMKMKTYKVIHIFESNSPMHLYICQYLINEEEPTC